MLVVSVGGVEATQNKQGLISVGMEGGRQVEGGAGAGCIGPAEGEGLETCVMLE